MKKNVLCFLILLSFSLGSCLKDEQPEKDGNYDDVLKSKLNALWMQIEPCDSCYTVQFTEHDSIILINTISKERLLATFEVISKDSIKIMRDWELEESKLVTFNRLLFYSDDTLEILKFLPVDYGVADFEDIKLHKTK